MQMWTLIIFPSIKLNLKNKITKNQKLLLNILVILVYIYLTLFSTNLCSGTAEKHMNWIGFLIFDLSFSQNYLTNKLCEFLIMLLSIHCRQDKRNRLQLFGIFDVMSHMRFDKFVTLPYTPLVKRKETIQSNPSTTHLVCVHLLLEGC